MKKPRKPTTDALEIIDRLLYEGKPERQRQLAEMERKARHNRKRKPESTAVQFLYDRYVGNDPAQVEAYEQEVSNAEIARKIFDLRTKAGLSQRELARRVGTSASAICRLEDADYEGHSLFLLRRIAAALGKRVEVRFVAASNRHRRSA